jgi:hypothetical protein
MLGQRGDKAEISNRADSCPISTDDPETWVNDGVTDHEPTVEYSDEEPSLPRPKSPESSEDDIPTQTHTLITYENISRPPTSLNEDTSTRSRYQRSPSPDQYRVSFAIILQEQQLSPTDMATMTTTTTAATTTVRPGTPPADPTMASTTSNSRSQ